MLRRYCILFLSYLIRIKIKIKVKILNVLRQQTIRIQYTALMSLKKKNFHQKIGNEKWILYDRNNPKHRKS